MRAAAALVVTLAAPPALSAPQLSPLPAPRPSAETAPAAPAEAPAVPHPTPRPEEAAAVAPVRTPAARGPSRPRPAGELCGDPRLAGARMPEISEPPCGIERPIRLTRVHGVKLTRPITVGCDVAVELADWVGTVARPAARRRFGEELAEITPFAGYVCRPVNNEPGASLSHHALGEAVDLGVFTMASGQAAPVTAWDEEGAASGFLRDLWEGACGPFGTVLGPEADALHEDHLHFDVAERRRAYCR